MKGHLNTAHGDIIIENEVIAKYAGITAIENFGIVGMASVNMKDGIVNLSVLRAERCSVFENKSRRICDANIIVTFAAMRFAVIFPKPATSAHSAISTP